MAIYIIPFILTFANMGLYLMFKRKYSTSLYSALYLLLVVASSGYLALCLSSNVKEAILATKITYLGGIWIPAIMLMILSKFINYKHHNILSVIGILVAALFFALICTIGYNDAYYVVDQCRIEYDQALGINYFIKTYGPLHILFPVYIASYMTVNVVFLIYAFTKTHSVSYKSLLYLVAIVVLTLVVSTFSDKIIPHLDLMPYGYVISGLVLFLLTLRLNNYNIDQLANINREHLDFYGAIVFDYKYNYLGSNNMANDLFAELKDLKIDRKMPEGDLYDKLGHFLERYNDNPLDSIMNIKRGDKTYKLIASRFNSHSLKRITKGFFIEVIDDTKQVEYINLLNNYSQELAKEVGKKTEKIKAIQDKVVLSMADMLETRDQSTGGHVKRTSDIISIILDSVKKLGTYDLDDEFYEYVRRAAPMHDLGKISISDQILNKPGRFTPEEFEIMKRHSAVGEEMVSAILEGIENERFVTITRNVARSHHEKYNGNGYPDGLIGDNIPVEARIMALADVYDALVSKRCYKEKMTYQEARKIIEESMGSHFDSRLQNVFNDAVEKLEAYYEAHE